MTCVWRVHARRNGPHHHGRALGVQVVLGHEEGEQPGAALAGNDLLEAARSNESAPLIFGALWCAGARVGAGQPALGRSLFSRV